MPEGPDDRRARVAAYVAAFNTAVAVGAWACLAAWFTSAGELVFPGSSIPPAHGREAIQAAYEAQPPDGTIEVVEATADPVSPGVDEVRFAWANGVPGRLRIRWEGDLVARLEVFLS